MGRGMGDTSFVKLEKNSTEEKFFTFGCVGQFSFGWVSHSGPFHQFFDNCSSTGEGTPRVARSAGLTSPGVCWTNKLVVDRISLIRFETNISLIGSGEFSQFKTMLESVHI